MPAEQADSKGAQMLIHYSKWAAAFYFTGLGFYFDAVGRSTAAMTSILLVAVSLYLFFSHRPEPSRSR